MGEELEGRGPGQPGASNEDARRGPSHRRVAAQFLQNNFTRCGEFYIPKDPTLNKYRHFGVRTEKGLCLRYEEALFIYSSECCDGDPKTRAYFDLKNGGFNVLFGHSTMLYVRTKHFNRHKEEPLGKLVYVHMDQDVLELCKEDTIAVVLGCDDYCFLSIKPLDELSHKASESHKKSRAESG